MRRIILIGTICISLMYADFDKPNGGAWKMADSPEKLRDKSTRNGTYDENLKRIGDYVYGTWSNTLTFSIFDNISSFISPNGYFNLNFSIANILGFNISISGNIYYEQGSDIP